MKAVKLRVFSAEELNSELDTLTEELFNLRMTKGLQKRVEKPHRMLQIKRDIARIKTIMNERKLGIAPAQRS